MENSSSDSENRKPNMPSILKQIDDVLEQKAELTQFSVSNVKSVIKAVITNPDVLSMIKDTFEDNKLEDLGIRMTRSKYKEMVNDNNKKIGNEPIEDSAGFLLLANELPEEESDEEYIPNNDTIATDISEKILSDDDDEEDICAETNIKIVGGDNIYSRTRSKVDLQKFPLEEIEKQFIPPDITVDMYDTECDNQDWLEFLKEFQQPLDAQINEDDDNDPEYNFMGDEELEHCDVEELRRDRAVTVPKKELKELLTELLTMDIQPNDDEISLPNCDFFNNYEGPPKEDTNDVNSPSLVINDESPPKEDTNEPHSPSLLFSDEQLRLLKQQLRQHIQLLTQNYLLCSGVKVFQKTADEVKSLLVNFQFYGCKSEFCYFKVENLQSSLEILRNWDIELKTNKSISKFLTSGIKQSCRYTKLHSKPYYPKLPDIFYKMCLNSEAFPYPQLLPKHGYTDRPCRKSSFSLYEDQLIALALEELNELARVNPEKFANINLFNKARLIKYLLVPAKESLNIYHRILYASKLKTKQLNPIKYYSKFKSAPAIKHIVHPYTICKLRNQPIKMLPNKWAKFLN